MVLAQPVPTLPADRGSGLSLDEVVQAAASWRILSRVTATGSFSACSIPLRGVDAGFTPTATTTSAEASADGCWGVPHCLASPPLGLLVGAGCSFFFLALGAAGVGWGVIAKIETFFKFHFLQLHTSTLVLTCMLPERSPPVLIFTLHSLGMSTEIKG